MSRGKTPKPQPPAADYPSAGALVAMNQLLAEPVSDDRGRAAWPLLVGAIGNPDFYAILDFAMEHGLAAGFDGGDPLTDPNPTWINPADGSEMVWIPPGRFVVGDDARPADCPGFSLARYPVTNAQFARFVAATGYTPPPDPDPDPGDDDPYDNGDFLDHWSNGKPAKGKANHPVVFVSYLDALAYCAWAGLTLPGEFLWEKAARGPDGRAYPWGDGFPGRGKVAHVRAAAPCPVDDFGEVRSPYGCAQMIGNVSEWCQPGDPADPGAVPPHAPEVRESTAEEPVYGAVRGSAFMRVNPRLMRSAHRRKLVTHRRNAWVGFRPALFLPCRPGQ